MFRGNTLSRSSPARRRCAAVPARARGFTLIEAVLAAALLAALAAIAVPGYQRHQQRVRVAQAASDLAAISAALSLARHDRGRFPDTLEELGLARTDPWGRAYRYLPLEDARNRGHARKDRALNPINTDFDLYSSGEDGDSVGPLTAPRSRDDIVRGRNGAFYGLAADF